MNYQVNPAFRKVRCIKIRRSVPDQIKVGNDYYIRMATITRQDGVEYAEVYRDPMGIEFVGRLCLRHFSDYRDRINFKEDDETND